MLLALASLLGVGLTFYLWFRRIESVSIPQNRTPFVASALGFAALGAAAFASSPGFVASIAATLAMLGGGLFATLVGISPQRTEGAIEVGDRLSEFLTRPGSLSSSGVPPSSGDLSDVTALDDSGRTVALSAYAGTPVLIKFFRGHW
jgi:hypothetical protein